MGNPLSPFMQALTQPTVDVPTAGRILGIGRDAAKKAAKAGEIPTIRLNCRDRVPTAKLREMLGLPVTTVAHEPRAA